MSEAQNQTVSMPHKRESVFFGAWNAMKKVPEWHEQQFMDMYDMYFAPHPKTREEAQVAGQSRRTVQKWANVAGWSATAIEAGILTGILVQGFRLLKKGKAVGISQEAPPALLLAPVAAIATAIPVVVEAHRTGKLRVRKSHYGDSPKAQEVKRKIKERKKARKLMDTLGQSVVETADEEKVAGEAVRPKSRAEGFEMVRQKILSEGRSIGDMVVSDAVVIKPSAKQNADVGAVAATGSLSAPSEAVQPLMVDRKRIIQKSVDALNKSLRDALPDLSHRYGGAYRRAAQQSLIAWERGKDLHGASIEDVFEARCHEHLPQGLPVRELNHVLLGMRGHFAAHWQDAMANLLAQEDVEEYKPRVKSRSPRRNRRLQEELE